MCHFLHLAQSDITTKLNVCPTRLTEYPELPDTCWVSAELFNICTSHDTTFPTLSLPSPSHLAVFPFSYMTALVYR